MLFDRQRPQGRNPVRRQIKIEHPQVVGKEHAGEENRDPVQRPAQYM